jgi:hypothetical protein
MVQYETGHRPNDQTPMNKQTNKQTKNERANEFK